MYQLSIYRDAETRTVAGLRYTQSFKTYADALAKAKKLACEGCYEIYD